MAKIDAYLSNEKQLQNHSIILVHKNQITSFSYQHSNSLTHALKHYCFFGQTNLYRLCGLWQVPTQIWRIFLDRKGFQLFGCETDRFQER